MTLDMQGVKIDDKEVKAEVHNALLRMSEHRVMAELRVEELEKESAAKDLFIQ